MNFCSNQWIATFFPVILVCIHHWMVVSSVTAFQKSTLSARLFAHSSFRITSSTNNRFSMVSSATNSNVGSTDDDANTSSAAALESGNENAPPPPKKMHSVTVCMVPPPEYKYVWETISNFRIKLKDPGLYRWPPHANLMYPFLQLGSITKNNDARKVNVQQVVEKIQAEMHQLSPFKVTLDRFGTFGGKQRGVLWLNPASSHIYAAEDSNFTVAPLIYLQQRLEEAFPTCTDQSKKGNAFTPHMTISHFVNLEAALEGQKQLELPKDPPLEFILDRIYLLERFGDGGQFLRVAQIGLGDDTASQIDEIFDPPSPFPDMPTEEADWVHEERMNLKSRRNGNRGSKGGANRERRRRSREARIPDTPEVIAAKRAQRQAKRERLEREQQEQQALGGESS